MVFWYIVVVGLVSSIWLLALKLKGKNLSMTATRKGTHLGEHQWSPIKDNSLPVCKFCSGVIGGWFGLNGVQCKVCQISSHMYCSRHTKGCKPVSNKALKHHWVEVYLPPDSTCYKCGMLCGTVYEVPSLTCTWCHFSYHKNCMQYASEVCNLGNRSVVPPTSVSLDSLKITELEPSVRPLVVIINPKSGGQAGEMALRAFYWLLNPIQVVNLMQDGLDRLKYFEGVKNLRILVAGGDGTVSRVLSKFYDEHSNQAVPPIGIFPLGTGNDLSYVLNWGKGMSSRESKNFESMKSKAEKTLKELSVAHISFLDRWNVCLHNRSIKKSQIMTNYIGLGLDAKIAHDFHSLRESRPYLFKSRSGNRFIYSQLGGRQIFQRACKDFASRVNLKCDNKRVKLPYLEGILIMNISSYSSGIDMWGVDEEDYLSESSCGESWTPKKNKQTKPSKQDGVLEVVGIKSILHLGECQVGLSKAVRVTQGRKLTIEIQGKEEVPLHIDGEPEIVQGPLKVNIEVKDQVVMLSKTVEKYQRVAKKVMDVLNWAEVNNIIKQDQKDVLLKEFANRCNI